MTGTVPVVDISPFITGAKAGRRAVVEQVRRACEDTGFFSIVGHGVPREAVERIRRDLADSFALPLEDKLAIKRPAVDLQLQWIHYPNLLMFHLSLHAFFQSNGYTKSIFHIAELSGSRDQSGSMDPVV